MATIELADHKGVWFVELRQREEWARTLDEQHPERKAARLDFGSAGDGLKRLMRMEGFRDLRDDGGWEWLEDGGARFMLLDGTWRYVTAEEIRDSIEAREHVEYRRKYQWMDSDDLDG